MSPRQPKPAVLELVNDTSEKECLLVLGAGSGAESSVQDEPIRTNGGESDELACLDARAHALLEHCKQLLAPSSTSSDKVCLNVLDFLAHLHQVQRRTPLGRRRLIQPLLLQT